MSQLHRLVVLATLLAWSTPAAAARIAVVVRGVGAGSDRAAALTGHFLREQLGKDERYEVVDLGKALGNQDRDRALKAFSAAEEMVQKGREAYDALQPDRSVEYLSNALMNYERWAAYVNDFKKVAEALMLLGATQILKNQEKAGSRRLEQALNVYPQMEPDPRIFNPAMRAQFQEAVSRMNTRPPGILSLLSNPSYAEVYVDGRFVGVTGLPNIAVDKLTEGRHYVRVEKDGYRPWGKVVEITGRTETAESAVLRSTSHFDEFDTLVDNAIKRMISPRDGNNGGLSNDTVDQLGVLVNAEQVFLVQVRMDGEKVQVWANQYDLNAQRLLKAADHVFTYDGRLEVFDREVAIMLRTSFGSNITRRPKSNAVPDVSTSSEENPLEPMRAGQARCMFGWPCRSVKVGATITGAGLGLIGMGLGSTFWVMAKQRYDQWKTTPQVSATGAELSTTGRADALRGDILFFTGAVLALAGAAAWVWWDPAPSPADVLEHSTRASVQVAPTQGGAWVNAAWPF